MLSNAHLCNYVELHKEILNLTASSKNKFYLFFDEIQEVDHFEKAINSFRLELDCDIYITGSNAKLLSGELATYLAGRYVEFPIYPFSFAEFHELFSISFPSTTLENSFKQYLIYGGMPYLSNLNYEPESGKQYLYDLYNAVILKDIMKRNNVRDMDLLERIISYITTNIGNTFSATSIVKYLKSEGRKVSSETVLNYIRYCLDTCLFYKAKRFDIKGKQVLSSNEKYYICDHGIREAIFGNNIKDLQLILENIVFMELIRRNYKVYVGKDSEKEIDFICEKQGQKLYIQVSYLLASPETIHREFSPLLNIQDNYPKLVISMDDLDFSRNGIKHLNIISFLMNEHL